MEDVLIKIKGTAFEYYFKKDIVSIEEIFAALENEIDEKETIAKEFEDFKQDVEDNYKQLTAYEQLGISQRDFI